MLDIDTNDHGVFNVEFLIEHHVEQVSSELYFHLS